LVSRSIGPFRKDIISVPALLAAGAGIAVSAALFINLILHCCINYHSKGSKVKSLSGNDDEAYFREMVETINTSPHARWKARYNPYGWRNARSMLWVSSAKYPEIEWTDQQQLLYQASLNGVAAQFDTTKMREHLE